MHPWYSDPLWAFIGNAAQVLSLIGIGVALWELWRQRRQVEPVVWAFDIVGTAKLEHGNYHIADFYNAGTGTGTLLAVTFVDAEFYLTDEHRFLSVMGPGECVTILVTAERLEAAWILITWRSNTDGRLGEYQWLPVANPGSMQEAWQESHPQPSSQVAGALGIRAPSSRTRAIHAHSPEVGQAS